MVEVMDTRRRLRLVSAFLNGVFLVVICVLLYKPASVNVVEQERTTPRVEYTPLPADVDAIRYIAVKLFEQRNAVSKQLNSQLQKTGEIQCKLNDFINERGGYCITEGRNQIGIESGKVPEFRPLFTAMARFLRAKKVASFGEGAGVYAQQLLNTGLLTRLDSYDGNPFCNETSEGRVQFLDLSVPQYGLPVYDWIISIEVAEHIPPQFESAFLDNMARHAREGVIMSWAVPGQPGVGHVNCRTFEYVTHVMWELGYQHDRESTMTFQNLVDGILNRNLNVFYRVKQDLYIDFLN